MAKSKPVTIGARFFPRQLDALAFFKEMLGRYAVGQQVSAADSADLGELLKRHIRYGEKVGVGLEEFCVMLAPEGSKCFGVVRRDQSRVPFTYKCCVTGIW